MVVDGWLRSKANAPCNGMGGIKTPTLMCRAGEVFVHKRCGYLIVNGDVEGVEEPLSIGIDHYPSLLAGAFNEGGGHGDFDANFFAGEDRCGEVVDLGRAVQGAAFRAAPVLVASSRWSRW